MFPQSLVPVTSCASSTPRGALPRRCMLRMLCVLRTILGTSSYSRLHVVKGMLVRESQGFACRWPSHTSATRRTCPSSNSHGRRRTVADDDHCRRSRSASRQRKIFSGVLHRPLGSAFDCQSVSSRTLSSPANPQTRPARRSLDQHTGESSPSTAWRASSAKPSCGLSAASFPPQPVSGAALPLRRRV